MRGGARQQGARIARSACIRLRDRRDRPVPSCLTALHRQIRTVSYHLLLETRANSRYQKWD